MDDEWRHGELMSYGGMSGRAARRVIGALGMVIRGAWGTMLDGDRTAGPHGAFPVENYPKINHRSSR